jgi:hypothetical protein
MEENNDEELNWRDPAWRDSFFTDFIEELRLCKRENLEPNPQNVERYNSTRERCQFVFNYYLARLKLIVDEMENTETPREIVQSIINHLQDVIVNDIFEGMIDEVSESFLPEELQTPNPMTQGNNQEWSELSLVNHFNTLYRYYMRVIQYINREHTTEGGGKKYRKYKKSRKTNKKSKKTKKKSRKARKQKSKKRVNKKD